MSTRNSSARPWGRCAPRHAAAALEMALILPLMITLVLGCVDFGRFCYMHIALTNAVRAGAGVACFRPFTTVTKPAWEAAVTAAVQAEMAAQAGFVDVDLGEQLSIAAPVVTTEANGLKRVKVQATYQFQTIVTWPLLPSSVEMVRSVQMRIIR